MYYSQNGYTVIDSRNECKDYDIDDFSLPLRPDDCGFVLRRFANAFDKRVEDLGKTETFGWNRRQISGSNEWSNHASGTAVDLNSSKHPHGAVGTFTEAQVAIIRSLLTDDFDDVIRWGGDYRYTKDEMHFEINKDYTAVRLLASVQRRGGKVYLSRLKPGKRNLDIYMVKRMLVKKGFYSGSMSKYFSVLLKDAYAEWQRSLGYTGADADGVPGKASLEALGLKVV